MILDSAYFVSNLNLYESIQELFIIITIVRTSFDLDPFKDQFQLRSNTGMDPGPRSPNNEFVECGKKS